MKKIALLMLAISTVGCATTGTTENSSANQTAMQTITLEQALQKSAETREKLLEAKKQYEQAKLAAEVAAGKKTATQAAQEQIESKLDAAKKQLQDEKNAWAELLTK